MSASYVVKEHLNSGECNNMEHTKIETVADIFKEMTDSMNGIELHTFTHDDVGCLVNAVTELETRLKEAEEAAEEYKQLWARSHFKRLGVEERLQSVTDELKNIISYYESL